MTRICFLFCMLSLLSNPVIGDDTSETESVSSKISKLWKKGKEATLNGAQIVTEKSSDAWDATQDASKEAWDATREKSGEVADATTEAAREGWNSTREATKKALNYTAGKIQKASEAINPDEPDEDRSEAEVVDRSVNKTE